ncbi:hypothetical protein KIL84_014200, partial [Mauremys mutica]
KSKKWPEALRKSSEDYWVSRLDLHQHNGSGKRATCQVFLAPGCTKFLIPHISPVNSPNYTFPPTERRKSTKSSSNLKCYQKPCKKLPLKFYSQLSALHIRFQIRGKLCLCS